MKREHRSRIAALFLLTGLLAAPGGSAGKARVSAQDPPDPTPQGPPGTGSQAPDPLPLSREALGFPPDGQVLSEFSWEGVQFQLMVEYELRLGGSAGLLQLKCGLCVHSLTARPCNSTCDPDHGGPDRLHSATVPGQVRPLNRDIYDDAIAALIAGTARTPQVSKNVVPRPEANRLEQFRQWARRPVTVTMDHVTGQCWQRIRDYAFYTVGFTITGHLFRVVQGGRQEVGDPRGISLTIAEATKVSRVHQAERVGEYCMCGTRDALPAGERADTPKTSPRPRTGTGRAKVSLLELPRPAGVAVNYSFQAFVMEGSDPDAVARNRSEPTVTPPAIGFRRLASTSLGWSWSGDAYPTPARRMWPGARMRASRAGAAVAQAPGDVTVSLIAAGVASGPAFRMEARGQGGSSPIVTIPDGLVVQALDGASTRTRAARAGAPMQTESLNGYCLEFEKQVPVAGALYRIAEPAMQQQFQTARQVLGAGRFLARTGRLHPDSNPAAYHHAVKQWALWTHLAGWDETTFVEKFVARTHETARQLKQTWTRALEDRVREAAPNRWRDIRAVLDEAHERMWSTTLPGMAR
ncbi:MAG: hypothetical protein HYS05_11800 [Acidobacteria bacterium]|nr:hypothetical protein [Acidobacteriota bacterium]